MQTQNAPHVKAKAVALKSMMKNKNLAKVLFESWDAKPGSTKNKRAASILRSIYKSSYNYNLNNDGQGGPGDFSSAGNWLSTFVDQSKPSQAPVPQAPTAPYSPPATPQQKAGTVLTQPTPAQPITQVEPVEPVIPPTTKTKFIQSIDPLLEEMDSYQKATTKPTPSKYYSEPAGLKQFKPAYDWLKGKVNTSVDTDAVMAGHKANFVNSLLKENNDLTILTLEKRRTGTGKKSQEDWMTSGILIPEEVLSQSAQEFPLSKIQSEMKNYKADNLDASNADIWNWYTSKYGLSTSTPSSTSSVFNKNDYKGISDTIANAQKTAGVNFTEATPEGINMLKNAIGLGEEDPIESDFSGENEVNYGDLETFKNEYGETELDTWYNSLDPSLQSYYNDVYEAVKTGVGADTWAFQAMTDPNILEALGIPQEVIDQLPKSGLLSQQINDLYDATKKEYKLDDQLSKILDLQNRGVTIENDFNSYVRGKDEYLTQVNDLLEKSKNTAAFTDTSNPYVAKRLNNYLSYLTVLKGRQNQRYIDFVDTSIKEYQADLAQHESLYKTSSANAQESFKKLSSVTEESYNQMKVMLKDMYTNVDKRTELMRDTEKFSWDKAQAERDEAMDVLDMVKSQIEIDGGGSTDNEKITNLTSFDNLMGITEDDDGNLNFMTYNPLEAMQNVSEENYNPRTALTRFTNFSGKNIKDKIKGDGDFVSEFNKYKPYLSAMEESEMVDETLTDDINSAFWRNIQSGLREYLMATPEKTKELRDSIDDLVGKGWFNKSESSRQSFVSGNSGLGNVAGLMFDFSTSAVEKAKEAGTNLSLDDVFSGFSDLDDKDLVNTVSNELADYLIYGEGS